MAAGTMAGSYGKQGDFQGTSIPVESARHVCWRLTTIGTEAGKGRRMGEWLEAESL